MLPRPWTLLVATLAIAACGGRSHGVGPDAQSGSPSGGDDEDPAAGANDPEPTRPDGADPAGSEGGDGAMLPEPSQTLQRLYRAMVDDLRALPAETRPFARYVSLSERVAAGAGPDELEDERWALQEAINGASLGPTVVALVALSEPLLARLDLRDYGWDRSATVDDVVHPDGWEAIVDATGLATSLRGPLPEAVARETHAGQSLLPSSALVDALSTPDVYRALLDVPATEAELQRWLEIAYPAFDSGRYVLTAYARGEHEHEGADRGTDPSGRFYWRGFYSAHDAESIYDDPFESTQGQPSDALFVLPNGLTGYFPSQRLAEWQRPVIASCRSCHAGGPIFAPDTLRGYFERNPRDFDEATYRAIEGAFVSAEELEALVARDAALQRDARLAADLPPEARGASHRVVESYAYEITVVTPFGLDFGLESSAPDLDVREVAAYLFATPARVTERLGDEASQLAREELIDRFSELFCAVHVGEAIVPEGCGGEPR